MRMQLELRMKSMHRYKLWSNVLALALALALCLDHIYSSWFTDSYLVSFLLFIFVPNGFSYEDENLQDKNRPNPKYNLMSKMSKCCTRTHWKAIPNFRKYTNGKLFSHFGILNISMGDGFTKTQWMQQNDRRCNMIKSQNEQRI